MDSMPNAGFWRDLPSLVKEGGGFAIGKVTGKGGGGAGKIPSGGDAYSSMPDSGAGQSNGGSSSGGYGATDDADKPQSL
jgi:hypothetical protein